MHWPISRSAPNNASASTAGGWWNTTFRQLALSSVTRYLHENVIHKVDAVKGARTQLRKTHVDGLFGINGLASIENIIAFNVLSSNFPNQCFTGGFSRHVSYLSLQPKDQRKPGEH